MKVLLRRGGTIIEVWDRKPSGPGGAARRLEPDEVQRLLRWAQQDPAAGVALRRLLGGSQAGSTMSRPRGRPRSRNLRARLAGPGLWVRESRNLLRPPHPPGVSAAAEMPDETADDTAQQRPQPEPRTWVAFRMVDVEQRPVAGVRFVVRLPDGSTREGSLGADGAARIEDVPAGICTVQFPELDRVA